MYILVIEYVMQKMMLKDLREFIFENYHNHICFTKDS